MVFVLDTSSSVSEENFGKVLRFMTGMLERAEMIDSGDLRVAAMSFSTHVNVHFYLGAHATQRDVFRAIRAIPYSSGSTNTADALMTLRNELFNPANGDRPDVPNLAIIITDGVSNLNSQRTIPEAVLTRDYGIHIFAIGIGLAGTTHEIDSIASPPVAQNRFLVTTFDELHYIRTQVYTRLCESKCVCVWGGGGRESDSEREGE
jgi:collagen type VI alpha